MPRFAALGATANIQPLWACHEPQMDELAIPLLGPARALWQYPFRSLAAAGAALAAGSDWPVTSPDPIQGMHVAVNRVGPGKQAEPLDPGGAADAGRGAHRVHGGHRAQLTTRTAPAASPPGCSPTWSCSTGTRSPSLRRRSTRRGSPLPSSRDSACSRPDPVPRSSLAGDAANLPGGGSCPRIRCRETGKRRVMPAEFTMGARVSCTDGFCGEVRRTILDPAAGTVTHLVVEPRHLRGSPADSCPLSWSALPRTR